MNETGAEVITLGAEMRQRIFEAGQDAAVGYATLQAAVRNDLVPSSANESAQLTEIRGIVSGLFSVIATRPKDEDESTLQDSILDPNEDARLAEIRETIGMLFPVDETAQQEGDKKPLHKALSGNAVAYIGDVRDVLNRRGMSDHTLQHTTGALALLANTALFVSDWNNDNPLADETVKVHGMAFYQRPHGSTRLESKHESRRTLLTMPRVSLQVLMPATDKKEFDLVLASDPDLVAMVKTDPDSLLGRVFKSHAVAGLALSSSGFLDDEMFVPSFTLVQGSWDNLRVKK